MFWLLTLFVHVESLTMPGPDDILGPDSFWGVDDTICENAEFIGWGTYVSDVHPDIESFCLDAGFALLNWVQVKNMDIYPTQETLCACVDTHQMTIDEAHQLRCDIHQDPFTLNVTDIYQGCQAFQGPAPEGANLLKCENSDIDAIMINLYAMDMRKYFSCQTWQQGFYDWLNAVEGASEPTSDVTCDCWEDFPEVVLDMFDCALWRFGVYITAQDMYDGCNGAPTTEPTGTPVVDSGLCNVNDMVGLFQTYLTGDAATYCADFGVAYGTYLQTAVFPDNDDVCPCALTIPLNIAQLITCKITPEETLSSLRADCSQGWTFPTGLPSPAPTVFVAEPCTEGDITAFLNVASGVDSGFIVRCVTMINELSTYSAATQAGLVAPFPSIDTICQCIDTRGGLIPQSLAAELTCLLNADGYTMSHAWLACHEYWRTESPTPDPTYLPTPDPTEQPPPLCGSTEGLPLMIGWASSLPADAVTPLLNACQAAIGHISAFNAGTGPWPDHDTICSCIDISVVDIAKAEELDDICLFSYAPRTSASDLRLICANTDAPTGNPSAPPTHAPTLPPLEPCDVQKVTDWFGAVVFQHPELQTGCTGLVGGFSTFLTTSNSNDFPAPEVVCACFDTTVMPREMAIALNCEVEVFPLKVTGVSMWDGCVPPTAYPSTSPTPAPIPAACTINEIASWMRFSQGDGKHWAACGEAAQPLWAVTQGNPYPSRSIICECINPQLSSVTPAKMDELICIFDDAGTTAMDLYTDCLTYTKAPSPGPTAYPTDQPTIPSLCTDLQAGQWFASWATAITDPAHTLRCNTLLADMSPYLNSQTLEGPTDEEVCGCVDTTLVSESIAGLLTCGLSREGKTASYYWDTCWKSRAPTSTPSGTPSRKPTKSPAIDLCDVTDISQLLIAGQAIFATNQALQEECTTLATKTSQAAVGQHVMELTDYCRCFDTDIVPRSLVEPLQCKMPLGFTPLEPTEIYDQCVALTKFPSQSPSKAPTRNPTGYPTGTPTSAPTLKMCTSTDFQWALQVADPAVLVLCLGAVNGLTNEDALDVTSADTIPQDLCGCLNAAPYTLIRSTLCHVALQAQTPVGPVQTLVPVEELWWQCNAFNTAIYSANDYGRNWWDQTGDKCYNKACGYGLLDANMNCACYLGPLHPLGSNVVRVNIDQCNSNNMPLRMSDSVVVLDACWPMSMSALPALNLGDDSLYGFEYVKVSYDPLTDSFQWKGYADNSCLFSLWDGEEVQEGTCAAGFMGGTEMPTQHPTEMPTPRPSNYPSIFPTPAPSNQPTKAPSGLPSSAPTDCSWNVMVDALMVVAAEKQAEMPDGIYDRWVNDCDTFTQYIENDYLVDNDVTGFSNRTMMCGCVYAEHIFGAGYDDGGTFRDTYFTCAVDQYLDGPAMWSTCSSYWQSCNEADLIAAAAQVSELWVDTQWSTACALLAQSTGTVQAQTTGILPLTNEETCACLDTRPNKLPSDFGDEVLDCWFTSTVHGSYYWNMCLDYYLGCDGGAIIEYFLPRVLQYEAVTLEQTGILDTSWGTACLRVASQFQNVVGTGLDVDLPSLEDTCPCLNPDMLEREDVEDNLTCWLTDSTMVIHLFDLCAQQTGWLSGSTVPVIDTGRRREGETKEEEVVSHFEEKWRALWEPYLEARRLETKATEIEEILSRRMAGPGHDEFDFAEAHIEPRRRVEPVVEESSFKITDLPRRRPAIGEGTPVIEVCMLCQTVGGIFNLGYTSCYQACFSKPHECLASPGGSELTCISAGNGANACLPLAVDPTICGQLAPAEELMQYELSQVDTLSAQNYEPLQWEDTIQNSVGCRTCLAVGTATALQTGTAFDASSCAAECTCSPAACLDPALVGYCMLTCFVVDPTIDLTTDSDSDGFPDYMDLCPYDALKTSPGDCGCGVADTDDNANNIADCVEAGQACQPVREWSAYVAAVLCPGEESRAHGVKMCADYDNPMWQRRLEVALANSMYSACDAQCVYDIESSAPTRTVSQWGFRWIAADQCYTAMQSFYCLINQKSQAEEAVAKAAAFCALPAAPCHTVLEADDWTPELAASRCPVRNGEPEYTSDITVCNDWERDPWGYYEAAGTLYGDRLHKAMANHVYRSCNSRCVYDIESGGSIAFQWHSYFKCWKKQTWWNCFTVYVSEWNEAKAFIAGEHYDGRNIAYPPLCRELEHTPAPTALGCVARVMEQDWTTAMADAVCPPSRSGSTIKGTEATLCPDHRDWDIMTWRLRTSLSNRMFKTCLDWCVYDLTTYASSAFIWNDHLRCYNHVTWYTCINELYLDRNFLREWSEEALCDSSTPEPTYQPTCRPEWYYSEDRLHQLCAPTGTGITYKHVDTLVNEGQEDEELHDAVVCPRAPCQPDFPELIVSHPECDDCSGTRVTGATADCSAIFSAIQAECSSGCGGLAASARWTSAVGLLRDRDGNKFLDGDVSFSRVCAISLGICNECTNDPGTLPDHATCADATAGGLEAACNTTAIASACPLTCGTCDTETVPSGQEDRHPATSDEYAADMEDLMKSLANRMYQDCTSWCVYSWNRIHLETYGWKWSQEEKCWNPGTFNDCFWNYGTENWQEVYLDYKSAREVTCTRAPTTSPTGCYPTDYEWNQARSEELCEFQDMGATDKTLSATLCANSVQYQALFEQNIALAMFPKCNSLCIYDYNRMIIGLANDPIYAPNGQFRWHGTDECWEHGANGYQTCVGDVFNPVQDWLTVADHVRGFCGNLNGVTSEVAWED